MLFPACLNNHRLMNYNFQVDKIAGGATYARVDLPKFVNRKAAAKAAKAAGKTEL